MIHNNLESLFTLLLFEWPSCWGMSPWRPLKFLAYLFLLLIPLYITALFSKGNQTGIWKVDEGSKEERKLDFRWELHSATENASSTYKNVVYIVLHAMWIGFYFSLLSAFQIGWKELTVGNWIARIQGKEYSFKARGWVRTLSGIQSLISVYLLALWALSYFGRPFE